MALKTIKYRINGVTVKTENLDLEIVCFPPVVMFTDLAGVRFGFVNEGIIDGALNYEMDANQFKEGGDGN